MEDCDIRVVSRPVTLVNEHGFCEWPASINETPPSALRLLCSAYYALNGIEVHNFDNAFLLVERYSKIWCVDDLESLDSGQEYYLVGVDGKFN